MSSSKVARRSKEMQELINIVKENINKITYGSVMIKDIDAERIIAQKTIEAGIIRKQ